MASDPRPSALLRTARFVLVFGGATGAVWTVAAVSSTSGLSRTPGLAFVLLGWLSLVGTGAALPTRYRRSALWAALSLVGYGLTLQLVDAGTAVLYPHLRPAVARLAREDWALVGGLAACAGVVLAGLGGHAGPIRAWLARQLGPVRLVVILAVWAAISASPLRDIPGFALEIVLATALALVATGAVILSALSLPPDTPRLLARVGGFLGRDEPGDLRGPDPVALGASLFVVLGSGVLAWTIWERHPHLSDEISFLFQAKYFAAGALVAPGVPVPELFTAYQIECGVDRCLSVLQPGWPALLSLGVRAHVPWLVNPLLAGANALLFFAFARELYGRRLARGAVVLLACCPWYLFLAMSYMNHQGALLGGLVAVLGTTLAIRRGRWRWALLAGLGAGFASLMRPMDGVIVAAVAGAPLLFAGPLRRRVRAAVAFAIGTALLGSLNLAYNQALTGDPLEFPVTSYVNELWGEGSNNLGFGPDRGIYPNWAHMDAFPGHSPFQAVVNADLNVTALQFDMFGWAVGSLLPLLLLLVWARLDRRDWLMVGWLLVINALYSLYWFASGPDFAARYWFLGVVPLVMLTARGLDELAARAEAGAPGRGRRAVAAAAGLLVVQGLLVFVPWRATDKYFRYFSGGPLAREALADGRWPPGIYLIRSSNQPDYAAAMVYNAPDLASAPQVFAYDSLSNSVELLREAYPNRRVWGMVGPSATGDVYRIYADPSEAVIASPIPR